MSYANINLARSVSERNELMASLAASNKTLETQMGLLINDLLAFSRLGKAHLSVEHMAKAIVTG